MTFKWFSREKQHGRISVDFASIVAALTATAAIGIIGYSATTTAVGMCALAGGVFAGKSMLNSLRDNYIATQITKNSDGDVTKIVLKRK